MPSDPLLPLFLGALFAGFYFLVDLCRSGMPPVVPLSSPPEDLSPGQLRYALKRRYDSDSFAADILHLVFKGAMRMEKESNRIVLIKEENLSTLANKLSPTEQQVLDLLFAEVDQLLLRSRKNVREARAYLEKECKSERLFTRREKPFLLGLFLMFIPLELSLTSFRLMIHTPIVVTFFTLWFSALFAIKYMQKMPGIFLGIFWVLLGIALAGITVSMPNDLFWACVFVPLLPLAFVALFPKCSDEALKRLTQAEGLSMYLKARKESGEYGKALMPYALALGGGKAYFDKISHSWHDMSSFCSLCALASGSPVSDDYGSHWNFPDSSSSSYSSSSDSSGGGGSGGGGGGGW